MNSFGRIFRISIFGESHGKKVGVCIDGCPAGLAIDEADFRHDLSRRQGGGGKGTTPRREPDSPNIVSGVVNGCTTGSPITILFENTNTRSSDYDNLRDIPRPGHADFSAYKRYGGFADMRGSGHFSGRLTVGIVAAGVVAKKIIAPAKASARLVQVGGSEEIDETIAKAADSGDSVGGLIECLITGIEAGVGEPFFDSVEARLSHFIFAVPATRGIEFGTGFNAAMMLGSEHNDPFCSQQGRTLSNHAGGINGGITNGNDIIFRVAVKPASSIAKPQTTMNFTTGSMETLEVHGRHDACIAVRIVPVIEAAAAITMADMILTRKAGEAFRGQDNSYKQ
ncbi:Chorismate synthase [Limihaloglobus sulfuriphilus]|uniref:Chorismate synthase n=1 Tax=Limihaloglobus sulfuriphilus TaxID=1851148 RepID=A0A1Q2MDK0_9BACT|nr:chorismate synthase [Limihaloglobus sulfuriphilus]AQQ70765.1 Chorismate synthase [Limihaloglobus sulfuriphilus]